MVRPSRSLNLAIFRMTVYDSIGTLEKRAV